ncbi:hypothetical protein B0I35DRAFT_412078 [Stachybotrys elegans]|uniref:Uncharacterized protein n=1 Tax=Stachybotrys elegans TaxID=80388 RepID=A0A8K0SK22_9HYPO|nr:hypothetical protein B0I35DRAFT_412078 [Stachybotrys elegans]
MASPQELLEQLARECRQRKVLIASSIPLRTPRADVEAACRARLSRPETARFYWEAHNRPWFQHSGRVFIGFGDRPSRKTAHRELEGLIVSDRAVEVREAPRQRYTQRRDPVTPHVPPGAASASAPAAPVASPAVADLNDLAILSPTEIYTRLNAALSREAMDQLTRLFVESYNTHQAEEAVPVEAAPVVVTDAAEAPEIDMPDAPEPVPSGLSWDLDFCEPCPASSERTESSDDD